MADISLLNYFGTANDFENLKKWFRINSDLYRDVIVAAKERYDLETEYSTKLAKINAKILKSFSQSIGCVSILWSKTAHFMNEEAEAHKILGSQIHDEFYKQLVNVADQFNKYKKPIENEIDKCLKVFQEKQEEEFRLKKKAFVATKDSEKAYESINEYKLSHPSSVSGNDKDRSKIEKRASQFRDMSTKAEAEYFDASLASEGSRHKWEQSFVSGMDQLQKFETDRLNSMKAILESYQRSISKIPVTYNEISNKLMREISIINIRDDLFENCMHFTKQCPNVYKTEQSMLDFYAESKDNQMDLNRRKENLMKRINVLYQHQKKSDSLRTGTLKMLTVYEDSPQFADEVTRKKTKREYSKIQSLVNLISANIYKVQVALNTFDSKPEPPNPLTPLGMKILITTDRNSLIQSILESKPGTILPSFEPGIVSISNSNSGSISKSLSAYDDDDYFISDSDEEPVQRRVVSQVSQSSTMSSSYGKPMSQVVSNNFKSTVRPLPSLPTVMRYTALHTFVGRDKEELSFKEGDIINVRNKVSDVWWEGELKGKVGLIPANYVEEL